MVCLQNAKVQKRKRWLKALQLAKMLFEDEGYFVDYLVEIEEWIKNDGNVTRMEDEDGERYPDTGG